MVDKLRKKGTGRKPRDKKSKSELVKKRILGIAQNLQLGMSTDSACRAAGINPSTYYDWKKYAEQEKREPYSTHWHHIDNAYAIMERDLLQDVHNAAKDQYHAATWLLERRFAKRWGKQQQITQITVDRTQKAIESMTDESLEEEIALLEKELAGSDE